MNCPKCSSEMKTVTYDDVEVDRCSGCQGLWFDGGEIEPLRHRQAAEAIDIGDAERGAELNATENYVCPRCSGGMIKMVDAQQPHIWFESCGACGGAFFDAGEFRDLATHSVAEFFKDLFAPERK